MFELTINNEVYQFSFGIGFVREINKTAKKPVDGVPGASEDVGLALAVAKIMDGDVVTLVEVLDLANKGKAPRVTRKDLEAYIDSEDTDIDTLFEDVLGFFEKANATRKTTKKLLGVMEMSTKSESE